MKQADASKSKEIVQICNRRRTLLIQCPCLLDYNGKMEDFVTTQQQQATEIVQIKKWTAEATEEATYLYNKS